jgi:uncharacterized protein YaiE (UPF0345 family)
VLDAIVMLTIADRDLTAPPATPAESSRYLVASGASDAWSGYDDKIAVFADGAWTFHTPQEGWLAWIADEDIFLVYDGVNWTGAATENATRLGVNTTSDTSNRLAVASEALLFTHAGAGVQAKLNKASSSNVASILFQTDWSGRAEIGCLGDDDFRFKVSADGSIFNTGLTLVSAASGVPRLPSFMIATLPSATTAGAGAIAYVSDASNGPTLAFSDGAMWRYPDGSTLT